MFVTALALLAAQPAEAAPGADAAEDNELVCKRVREEARRTGSNLRRPSRSKKVCRTATEWAEIEASKDEFFRELNENQGNGDIQPSSVGG